MLKNLKLIDSKLSIVNKVGTLTFCRNDIRNALTGSSITNDIINTIEYINKNNTVSVLIITGEGKAFSSGGNIKEMFKKNTSFSGPVEEVEKKYRYGIQQIPLYMEKIEIPTIAAINGPAVGAGFDLACMCDFRIMSNNALTVENLNKIYSNSKTKKETKAITDLTFEVKEGEVFGLLGPNGAGKSMFLKTINGLIGIDSGKIFFNSKEINDHIRKEIAMVFQKPILLRRTVFENMKFILKKKTCTKFST